MLDTPVGLPSWARVSFWVMVVAFAAILAALRFVPTDPQPIKALLGMGRLVGVAAPYSASGGRVEKALFSEVRAGEVLGTLRVGDANATRQVSIVSPVDGRLVSSILKTGVPCDEGDLLLLVERSPYNSNGVLVVPALLRARFAVSQPVDVLVGSRKVPAEVARSVPLRVAAALVEPLLGGRELGSHDHPFVLFPLHVDHDTTRGSSEWGVVGAVAVSPSSLAASLFPVLGARK